MKNKAEKCEKLIEKPDKSIKNAIKPDNHVKEILEYSILLIIVTILAYWARVAFQVINVDQTAISRYLKEGYILYQQRFGIYSIGNLILLYKWKEIYITIVGILLTLTASILYCKDIKEITKGKIYKGAYVIFSCTFVSYPLIAEWFSYNLNEIFIPLNYIISAILLHLLYNSILHQDWKSIVIQILLLMLGISIYESIVPVYFVGAFIMLILNLKYGEEKIKFGRFLKIIIFTFLVAYLLRTVIGKLIIMYLPKGISSGAATTIAYKKYGILVGLEKLKDTLVLRYVIGTFYYLPITYLTLSIIIGFTYFIKLAKKEKNKKYILYYIGLLLFVFSLDLIVGNNVNRTCQTFPLFVAFVFLIMTTKESKYLLLVLIIIQAIYMNTFFYANHLRYEDERQEIKNTIEEIKAKYPEEKKIMMIGKYKFPEEVQKIVFINKETASGKFYTFLVNLFNVKNDVSYKRDQNAVQSFIAWGEVAFIHDNIYEDLNTELIKVINSMGYDYVGAERENLDVIKDKLYYDIYIQNGRISKFRDFVLVIN